MNLRPADLLPRSLVLSPLGVALPSLARPSAGMRGIPWTGTTGNPTATHTHTRSLNVKVFFCLELKVDRFVSFHSISIFLASRFSSFCFQLARSVLQSSQTIESNLNKTQWRRETRGNQEIDNKNKLNWIKYAEIKLNGVNRNKQINKLEQNDSKNKSLLSHDLWSVTVWLTARIWFNGSDLSSDVMSWSDWSLNLISLMSWWKWFKLDALP